MTVFWTRYVQLYLVILVNFSPVSPKLFRTHPHRRLTNWFGTIIFVIGFLKTSLQSNENLCQLDFFTKSLIMPKSEAKYVVKVFNWSSFIFPKWLVTISILYLTNGFSWKSFETFLSTCWKIYLSPCLALFINYEPSVFLLLIKKLRKMYSSSQWYHITCPHAYLLL